VGVGFWAEAMLVIANKIDTPIPPAMRWVFAVEGCWLGSRENQPIFFM
jgi:hypothetical protein